MKQIASSSLRCIPRRNARNSRYWLALAMSATLVGCGGGADTASRSLASSHDVTAAEAVLGQLAVGLKDEPYSAQIPPLGGAASSSFTIVDGELPPGLALDAASGEITGRPARVGVFSFTVRTQAAAQQAALQKYTIYIDQSAGDGVAADTASPDVRARRIQPLSVPANGAAAQDVSGLLNTVAGMAPGEWRRVNLNAFSDVWTPADLRPMFGWGNPTPSKIILAWSGFAWDSNRASLLLYGGGHANYSGNDVYAWRASTQMWERASLPSAMVQNALGQWNAIDGVDKAPASAHTYDNNIFLPVLDRMLVLGGAADPNGGHYLTMGPGSTARVTGPYLFDPSRASPDKVGGSTGSHVQRVAPYANVLGGNMWSNRESWLNASATSTPPTEALVNGCTGYAEEQGRDVVYVRTADRLYRYQIQDLANPAGDSWKKVGQYYYGGSGGQSTCGYDPVRKIFLSTHSSQPFIFWDLSNPNVTVRDTLVTPTDPTGEFPQLLASGDISLRNCGLEFDPARNNFKLWCGDGRVWTVTPPATLGAAGWTIAKAALPAGAVPSEGVGTGILGKWKYVPNLDVFMGLADAVQGNIWIYKPHGWVNPTGGNLPPSVAMTAPQQGTSFTVGAPIAVSADAADGDGAIAKVEFFANGTKIGERLAAPFSMVWADAGAGNYNLTAVATDNGAATRTSAPVNISVNPVVVPNVPPTVQMVRPVTGGSVMQGTPVTLEASAIDSDGSVVRVEFFSGPSKLGEATTAPFTWVWTAPPVGNYTITAVATDDRGGSATAAAVQLSVLPTPDGTVTVTLQRGIGTSVVADTYLSSYHRTLNFGATTQFQDQAQYYAPLVRFAIFQSEGGPVPNGARIASATVSMYKYTSYNMAYSMYRVLKSWTESSATWELRSPGVAWSSPGATGVGTDIAAVADASASTDFNPGWVNFDVTSSVQEIGRIPGASNFGWKLVGVSGYTTALKRMYSSESTGAGTELLRPKLTIVYE